MGETDFISSCGKTGRSVRAWRTHTGWGWRSARFLFVVVAVVFHCVAALASPTETAPVPGYRSIIRNYGPENGFSQNAVNALLQGRDGYLWIGTFGGLVRFDGNKFTTLRAAQGQSAQRNPNGGGPGSDRIVALREDARGRLWIGTEDAGLSLYDHGRFRQLPVCGGTCQVHALSRQQGGDIWAATDAGLFRIATDTLRAGLVRDPDAILHTQIAIGHDGHVYVSGEGKLGKVVGESIVRVPLPEEMASAWQLLAVGSDIWVMSPQGLYRFDPVRNVWRLKTGEQRIRLLESRDGRLWLVTVTGKLMRTDRAGELRPVPGVPEIYTNAIWQDRAGTLWMGSNSKGLWSMQASKAMTLDSSQALAAFAGGRAVVGDGANGVWLGYGCGGVLHRREDGTYETAWARAVKKVECVISLHQDADGTLWIGTVDAGLQRIVAGTLEMIPQTPGLSNLQIWQADGGDHWLATAGHTFKLQRTETGTYALSPPVAALEGLTIRKMAMARRGGIWFVGDQGAVRLDKNRIVERWTPAEGLSSRFARSLYEDDRGVLWIGTYGGGLNRIQNGKITHYDESNGLFDDTVSCILADRAGQMWLGGNRGISVLPTASQQGQRFETIPFAVSAGEVTFEFNGGMQTSCYQDTNGHLWFALVTGFAEVDPARLVEISAQQPEVYIERVVTAGAKYDPGETVVLDAAMQPLEIGYTAINLTSPEQLGFRYRMSDGEWIDAGSTRDIIFQNVPWGEYRFEVQARNRGGSWSPSATLRISRPIPWYQQQWLWPVVVLLAWLALLWRTRDHDISGKHRNRLSRIAGRDPRNPARPE